MIAPGPYRALAQFLVEKRRSTTRDQVGLPPRPGRPTPQIIAKDICFLSGISITSYEQLERGRCRHITRGLMCRLAAALRLTPEETSTLMLLADLSVRLVPDFDPIAQGFLDSIKTSPAYMCTLRFDVFAYNRTADALFDFAGDGSARARNQLWRIYTDSQRRKRYKRPSKEKDFLLSAVKTYGASNAAADLSELLAAVSRASPTFDSDWASPRMAEPNERPVVLTDSKVGEMSMNRVQLTLAGTDALLMVLLPADDASDKAIRAIRNRPYTNRHNERRLIDCKPSICSP